MRKAKIVATIGPASRSRTKLRRLLEAGLDVARLNFSHGTHESHRAIIRGVREISNELGRPVAILQDLQGVKIRTGPLKDGKPVRLQQGQSFTISTRKVAGTAEQVSTSYASLARDLNPGDRILLSDGAIELEVERTTQTKVVSRVISGGTLAPKQGINLPGIWISAPALLPKDLKDLDFGIKQQVDYIALSFVRRPEDVSSLRRELEARGADTPIIAKLEKPAAIKNLIEILEVADGVMVARGDLGVEMSPEKVPIIQKRIIAEANKRGKLVITATQMLESMVRNPRPTRAEASDVANAVFDGTDGLMLSAETAAGRYPVESVQMMDRIISEAEKLGATSPYRIFDKDRELTFPEAVCESAYHASSSIRARHVVAFTQSGSTARMISKYRPPAQILGVTPHQRILRRMCLYWGVKPLIMHEITNVDELIAALEALLFKRGLVKAGENLIILTGAPIIEKGHTSLMKLHQVRGDASPAGHTRLADSPTEDK